MSEFSQIDYNNAVNNLAEAIVDEFLSEEYDVDYHDQLHEVVDGSEHIIYTHYHYPILCFASDPDYAVENGLIDTSGKATASSIIQTMAYFALESDVDENARERLNTIKEELEDKLNNLERGLLEVDEETPAYELVEKHIEKVQAKIDKIEDI